MSKRLQVLMDEREHRRLQRAARRAGMSVGEWVRRILRRAVDDRDVRPADEKLEALERAVRHDYPTADVARMLEEIEGGYHASGGPSR
jgi:hypothetical protein